MKEARDLYGLPIDRFVPGRSALVKALRESGQREQAAEVGGLRKPSVAAWAVNQLVRTQGRAVERLFAAGDALQHAHSQLLEGRGDGTALREALAVERKAVAELAESARGLLGSEGQELTPAMLDRVSETFHAAALDADARMQVKDGCLQRELRHIGLGTGGTASMPTTAADRRAATRAPSKTAERGAKAPSTPDKAAAARKQAERDLAKQLSAARKAETDARRVAERAVREVRSAEQHRDNAVQSLREAEVALAAVRQGAEDAAGAHRRSQQELERVSAVSPQPSP
ncbi:MAG: hypothetical protein M3018_07890 [Actinomycetota bacterium]|nr:hypothetical protein [Actinomycetota bacterium]